MKAFVQSDFSLYGLKSKYVGKVRDVYNIKDKYLAIVVTDRISAFDVVLPQGIPYKGQILNQIAAHFLDATTDILPNWKIKMPTSATTFGHFCVPYKVEMVVRGYLAGHAWREYSSGKRELCGVRLPDGLKKNEKLPFPIITPTTKAEEGHDQDISREEIIRRGIVSEEEYIQLERYAIRLFERGTQLAAEKGLILVDTKYEFGNKDGIIYLTDEIHTPDSSRYFYKEGYEECFKKGDEPRQLSKEFVREWLMKNGFRGMEGEIVPEMTPDIVHDISERYMELYQRLLGKTFHPALESAEEIESAINKIISELP